LVDFHQVNQGGCGAEYDLNAIFFNLVASTIPKWRAFRRLRRMQNLNQSTWHHKIVYVDRYSKDERLLLRPFLLKSKYVTVKGG
jgi:hypothetical protein